MRPLTYTLVMTGFFMGVLLVTGIDISSEGLALKVGFEVANVLNQPVYLVIFSVLGLLGFVQLYYNLQQGGVEGFFAFFGGLLLVAGMGNFLSIIGVLGIGLSVAIERLMEKDNSSIML